MVPQALRVLFSFQSEAIAPFITYDNYFGFVLQVCLALGISFELPLVLVILSWLGVIGPGELHRFRRYAIVLACIAGAVLSPGADVLSMIMMTVPLLLLYEVGVAGSALVHRRRKAAIAAGVVLLALLGWPSGQASAQVPAKRPARPAGFRPRRARGYDRGGRARSRPGSRSTAPPPAGSGIPTAPTRSFAAPDSVTQSLLDRPGYRATRYRADSATVFIREQRVHLQGQALTERQGATLEADSITYLRDSCILDAGGRSSPLRSGTGAGRASASGTTPAAAEAPSRRR